MRILHVIPSLNPRDGGPVTALIGLAEAQAQQPGGDRVSILSTWRDKIELNVADKLRASGAAVDMIGPARGPLFRHPDVRAGAAKAVGDADVVHIHSLWEEIQHQTCVAARRIGRPYILRPCGLLAPWSMSQSRLKKRLYLAWRMSKDLRRAAAIHFTSAAERDESLFVPPDANRIVEPNGLNLAEFEHLPEPGRFRARFPQLGRRPFVLFLSRIHRKKGFDFLVPAFASIQRKDVALVIAGPDYGGYQRELEAMIAQAGIGDRVIFTGMLHGGERVEALVDAELFALPSYQENFGNAVVEALAAATPVIISDQVNIWRELQSAGVAGVVPLDAGALARELDRWLADDALRRTASERARDFVWKHYDWRQIARRWQEHYARLIQAV